VLSGCLSPWIGRWGSLLLGQECPQEVETEEFTSSLLPYLAFGYKKKTWGLEEWVKW
jgi:hypothetical protein